LCDKDHKLYFSKENRNNYNSYNCDLCKKGGISFTEVGSWYCKEGCDYDVCPDCNGTPEQKVLRK
jgi:ribosomal protein L37AE/L43A